MSTLSLMLDLGGEGDASLEATQPDREAQIGGAQAFLADNQLAADNQSDKQLAADNQLPQPDKQLAADNKLLQPGSFPSHTSHGANGASEAEGSGHGCSGQETPETPESKGTSVDLAMLSPEVLQKRANDMYKQHHGEEPEWKSPTQVAEYAFKGLDMRAALGYRKPLGQRFDRALKHDEFAGKIYHTLDDVLKLEFKAIWAVHKTFDFTTEKRATLMQVHV